MKKTRKKGSRVKGQRAKGKDWTVKEFVDTVWDTMETQASKNPALKMLHARLEPEWNKIVQKISLMLEASKGTDTTKHVEEICKHGEKAVRPLIDALLKLKSLVLMEEECKKGDEK